MQRRGGAVLWAWGRRRSGEAPTRLGGNVCCCAINIDHRARRALTTPHQSDSLSGQAFRKGSPWSLYNWRGGWL